MGAGQYVSGSTDPKSAEAEVGATLAKVDVVSMDGEVDGIEAVGILEVAAVPEVVTVDVVVGAETTAVVKVGVVDDTTSGRLGEMVRGAVVSAMTRMTRKE